MTDRELTTFLRNVTRVLLDQISQEERFAFAMSVNDGMQEVARRYGVRTAHLLVTALGEHAREHLARAFLVLAKDNPSREVLN